MANFDYSEAQQVAKDLIEEFAAGRTLTILTSDSRANDPDKPWRGSKFPHTEAPEDTDPDPNPNAVTAPGVIIAYDEPTEEQLARGSMRCLVAYTGMDQAVDVSRAHAIKDGERVWSINSVNILQPGPSVIIYEFEVYQ